jgi:hypothetical protein
VKRTSVAAGILTMLVTCALHSSAAEPPKNEDKADSFLAKHRKAVAANPKGVKFEVRFGGKKRKFHPGEVIPLELVFSSSLPKMYEVLNKTYDRCGRDGSDGYMVDRPDDIVDPLREYFARGAMGGGGIWGWQALTAKPFVISRELNEWLRFDKPGKYRLYVRTGRVKLHAKKVGSTRYWISMASNIIEFEILKRDPQWAARQLKEIVAELDKGGERMEACRRLRYLDSEAAVREKAKRMCQRDVNRHFSFGLIGSRHREFAIKEMVTNLKAPDLPVRFWNLSTLVILTYYLENPLPPPSKAKSLSEDFETRFSAMRVAKHKLRGRYLAILWRGLQQKRGEARKVSTETFWGGAVNAPRPPPDLAKVIREHAAEIFEKQLQPHQQLSVLTYGWEHFRGLKMLPVLRRLHKLPGEDEDALKLRSAALRCLHDLSPKEGRKLILEEICSSRPRVLADVLVRLPDERLPRLEAVLVANLQNAGDAAAAKVISRLVNRYAGEKALPGVKKAFVKVTARWPTETRAPLLAYLLRVEHEFGKKKLKQAAAAEKGNSDEPWRSLLGEVADLYMCPEIERLALARLDGDDRFLAAASAGVLGRHGSARVQAALRKRLEGWHAKWRDRRKELTVPDEKRTAEVKGALALESALVSAIAAGRAWLTDQKGFANLEKLCLSSSAKWSLDWIRRKWKGGVAVGCDLSGYGDLHLFVGQYGRLSLQQARVLLARFPKGTKFRWASNHIIGRAAKKRKQIRSAIQAEIAKLGMKLDPGKPELW